MDDVEDFLPSSSSDEEDIYQGEDGGTGEGEVTMVEDMANTDWVPLGESVCCNPAARCSSEVWPVQDLGECCAYAEALKANGPVPTGTTNHEHIYGCPENLPGIIWNC